jgi:hypothetical protein
VTGPLDMGSMGAIYRLPRICKAAKRERMGNDDGYKNDTADSGLGTGRLRLSVNLDPPYVI